MRFLHRLYAALFGYFWLPCPDCGEMFGGHQISMDDTGAINVPTKDGWVSKLVCSACVTRNCFHFKRARELGYDTATLPGGKVVSL